MPDKLSEPAEIVQSSSHNLAILRVLQSSASSRESQIRSKFFSISRRVSLSMTGRPCGHTVEYAVALSSSRMCAIFSKVSG